MNFTIIFTTIKKGLGYVLDIINKYGYLEAFLAIIFYAMMLFITVGAIVVYSKPEIIIDRFTEYTEYKHHLSQRYRVQSAPQIINNLNRLAKELNAEHACIAEFHNGKNNPTGLQWQYFDMTFINDDYCDISNEYQNVSLVRYPFIGKLYEEGLICISIEDLMLTDKRLALRLASDNIKYVAATTMYGSYDIGIGFLMVFYENEPNVSKDAMMKSLMKYSNKISPLLDGANVKTE